MKWHQVEVQRADASGHVVTNVYDVLAADRDDAVAAVEYGAIPSEYDIQVRVARSDGPARTSVPQPVLHGEW